MTEDRGSEQRQALFELAFLYEVGMARGRAIRGIVSVLSPRSLQSLPNRCRLRARSTAWKGRSSPWRPCHCLLLRQRSERQEQPNGKRHKWDHYQKGYESDQEQGGEIHGDSRFCLQTDRPPPAAVGTPRKRPSRSDVPRVVRDERADVYVSLHTKRGSLRVWR
jgi:hypothetical protein